jgi:hypothetical protein
MDPPLAWTLAEAVNHFAPAFINQITDRAVCEKWIFLHSATHSVH